MAKVRESGTPKRLRPALTPEARENQLVNLAMDVAEEQLLNRTASSQVISHFLKLGTAKAELEREKVAYENNLLKAKTEQIKSQEKTEEFYAKVLTAMQRYSGYGGGNECDEVEEW